MSGKARKTYDPRGRMLSASSSGQVYNMTGAPDEGSPPPTTPDYQKVIDELKAANIALVEKVTALEEKSKGYDAKITALSGAANQANAQEKAKVDQAKADFDAAYEAALAKLGFKKGE